MSAPPVCESNLGPQVVTESGKDHTVTRPVLRSAVTIVTHFVIDVFSFIGIALLPMLAVLLDISSEHKALLLALGSVCSGAVQPLVAWASDRWDTRALGTVGFVVAVLCIGNLGIARDFVELAVLYSVGAMGVGAFHPPAAATVGRLGGKKRSIFVACFFLAGMLGGIVGNVWTPTFVEWMTPAITEGITTADASRSGLLAIRWFIPIGLVSAIVLALAIHSVGHRHANSHDHHGSWDPTERRRRWIAVWVLYASNVVRFTTNVALIYLFTEWASQFVLNANNATVMTEELGLEASGVNGTLQAAMQVGMGGGGITLGFILRARFEKLIFVTLPLIGALSIGMIPFIGSALDGSTLRWFVMGASMLAGLGFGATIPVSMSLAQRLLPHRTSLVSGMMLGGAWMLSFLGPLGAEVVQYGLAKKNLGPNILDSVSRLPFGEGLVEGFGLNAAFFVTACVLAVAGLLSLFLHHDLIVQTED